MHQFDPTILREYDIRGIVGKTLSATDAYAIGRSFAALVLNKNPRNPRVCVGYDGRLSSPQLESALVTGLIESGVDVYRIGRGPTPMLYFADKVLKTDGAIQVTGSHNPPDHNGFKMVLGGHPFFGPDIQTLGQIAAAGEWKKATAVASLKPAIGAEYATALLRDFGSNRDAHRDLTVVWDPGNGAAGDIIRTIVAGLPGRHIVINAEVDGTFPNHHPDPTDPATLTQLREAVLREGADLGLAFDGDGDRLGVLDDQGRIIWGDQYMVLFAEEVLREHPGKPVIADIKASQLLFDRIAELGGQPIMGRTGHSLIKTQMKKTGAPLAGEMSGHIFFADRYHGFDDAIYAALRLLSIVSRLEGPLSSWFDALPRRMSTPEIRIPCDDTRKADVVEQVARALAEEAAEVNTIDGVRVKTEDGWWLLRASNTQAVLVARAEADTQTGLSRLLERLQRHLERAGLTDLGILRSF